MKIRNKVDLHLHIDGSVNPRLMLEIAKKEGIAPYCSMTASEITAAMVIPEGEYDPDYLKFDPPIACMQSAYAIAQITEDLVCRLDEEGLIYAELRFAPQFHCSRGLTQEEAVKAACDGLAAGRSQCSTLTAGLILCAMNRGSAEMNHRENLETIRLAAKYREQGVVGVDLAGYEDHLSDFADLFALAKELEVPATCHSEFTVEQAVHFPVARIGHGYQFAQIPAMTEELIRSGITLEMCPDSSLSYEYGLSGDETHPLRVLFLAGAKVTVNTDNRTVLQTDLEKEYDLCRQMGFSDGEIVAMNNYAIAASFAPEEVKKELLCVQP